MCFLLHHAVLQGSSQHSGETLKVPLNQLWLSFLNCPFQREETAKEELICVRCFQYVPEPILAINCIFFAEIGGQIVQRTWEIPG